MGLSPAMRIVYGIVLAAFAGIAALGLAAGTLAIPIAALFFGGLFAVSAPVVFGDQRGTAPSTATRRPVRRRRR